jgi:hypothetical protein
MANASQQQPLFDARSTSFHNQYLTPTYPIIDPSASVNLQPPPPPPPQHYIYNTLNMNTHPTPASMTTMLIPSVESVPFPVIPNLQREHYNQNTTMTDMSTSQLMQTDLSTTTTLMPLLDQPQMNHYTTTTTTTTTNNTTHQLPAYFNNHVNDLTPPMSPGTILSMVDREMAIGSLRHFELSNAIPGSEPSTPCSISTPASSSASMSSHSSTDNLTLIEISLAKPLITPENAHESQIPTVSKTYRCTKVSAKKYAIEEPAFCRSCSEPISTMVLRGPPEAFEMDRNRPSTSSASTSTSSSSSSSSTLQGPPSHDSDRSPRPPTSNSKGYVIDILCLKCSCLPANQGGSAVGHDLLDKALNIVIVPSRKRAKGTSEKVVRCDVCRQFLGTGGVKISKEKMAHDHQSSRSRGGSHEEEKEQEEEEEEDNDDGHDTSVEDQPNKRRKGGQKKSISTASPMCHQVEASSSSSSPPPPPSIRRTASSVSAAPPPPPPFSVEVVCSYCRSHFAFCSDCGGGGKHRTGKYRPVQLFLPGRRTCKLSHVRYGDNLGMDKYDVIELDRPSREEMLKRLGGEHRLKELKETFEEGTWCMLGNPKIMMGAVHKDTLTEDIRNLEMGGAEGDGNDVSGETGVVAGAGGTGAGTGTDGGDSSSTSRLLAFLKKVLKTQVESQTTYGTFESVSAMIERAWLDTEEDIMGDPMEYPYGVKVKEGERMFLMRVFIPANTRKLAKKIGQPPPPPQPPQPPQPETKGNHKSDTSTNTTTTMIEQLSDDLWHLAFQTAIYNPQHQALFLEQLGCRMYSFSRSTPILNAMTRETILHLQRTFGWNVRTVWTALSKAEPKMIESQTKMGLRILDDDDDDGDMESSCRLDPVVGNWIRERAMEELDRSVKTRALKDFEILWAEPEVFL